MRRGRGAYLRGGGGLFAVLAERVGAYSGGGGGGGGALIRAWALI